MGKMAKTEPLNSRRFRVCITDCGTQWYVRDRESMADTEPSTDFYKYRELKRVWRRSKEDFESACRFMAFNNLFTLSGVRL